MAEYEWQQDIPDSLRCTPDVIGESFPSALAGEAITVHMPGRPEIAEGRHLSQPSIIRARVSFYPDPAPWGILHDNAVEPKLVAIVRRIGFTAHLADHDVVGREMNGWARRFTSWLDILTGQHLTPVGHKPPRQYSNRTCLFQWNPDDTALPEFTARD
ncbi:hypothetical protein FHY52_04470 [Nocardia nova]|uniref:hypothetical protein n=1 Tax=Nocardia nova TaxID=37330 RepID=UPI0025AF2B04|nr:hypothetical protein [Nocardia nova]MDN2495953.1 hypothetical protein [Nocardia nova]